MKLKIYKIKFEQLKLYIKIYQKKYDLFETFYYT